MQSPAVFGPQKIPKKSIEPQINLILRVGYLFPPHTGFEKYGDN